MSRLLLQAESHVSGSAKLDYPFVCFASEEFVAVTWSRQEGAAAGAARAGGAGRSREGE